jgi:hypothetical protein
VADIAADRIAHGQLAANTVDTVTLGRDFERVEVLNVDGAAPVYFTVDGPAPAVAGPDTFVLPAAVGAALELPATIARSGANTVVRLIAASAVRYSVRGV